MISLRPEERSIGSGAFLEAAPDIQAQIHEILQGAALTVTIDHGLEREPVGLIVFDKGGFTDVRFDFSGIATADRIRSCKVYRSVDERVKFYIY